MTVSDDRETKEVNKATQAPELEKYFAKVGKRMAGTTTCPEHREGDTNPARRQARRGLCRDRLDGFGFSATYILAGAAKSLKRTTFA